MFQLDQCLYLRPKKWDISSENTCSAKAIRNVIWNNGIIYISLVIFKHSFAFKVIGRVMQQIMYARLVIITITKNPGAKQRGVISHWRGSLCDNDRLTVHYTLHNKNILTVVKNRNIILLFYIPLAQTVEDNAAKTGLMASQLQKIEEKRKWSRKKSLYETYLGFIVKCKNHS